MTYNENFEDALPDLSCVVEKQRELEAVGVKYILSCWIDMLGVPKTKPVPISDFELLCMGQGPQFAVHSISFVPELGPADSDQIPLPDLDSLVICPWDQTCAWVFADLWWEDRPYNLCPRSALKRTVQNIADQGYAAYAGVEPLLSTSVLWKAPNLLVTPHVSADDGNTYVEMTLDPVFENLKRYLGGQDLNNIVRPELGY